MLRRPPLQRPENPGHHQNHRLWKYVEEACWGLAIVPPLNNQSRKPISKAGISHPTVLWHGSTFIGWRIHAA
jgi:hypothetical protein